MILSLSGIMTLLGLTWILSLFTFVGVDTNRDAAFALQWMFVFFNSLQGFFISVFFVVLSAEARNLWLTLLFPCYKNIETSTNKSQLRYTSKSSSAKKQNTFSSEEHSSMTLEKSVPKEKLSCEMVAIAHSVNNEKEGDQDCTSDLATIETAPDEKQSAEVQEVSEKPQDEHKIEDTSKDAEAEVLKARVRRVSTKRKTHHVETAEVDFTDNFSDESDDEHMIEDIAKDAEGEVLKTRVRRVSTKRKTHHVETAEVDFTDKFSDESDDDNNTVIP